MYFANVKESFLLTDKACLNEYTQHSTGKVQGEKCVVALMCLTPKMTMTF